MSFNKMIDRDSQIVPRVKSFNKHFLDLKDPTEFLGIELSGYTIALSFPFPLGYKNVPKIRQDLYNRIRSKLEEQSIYYSKYAVISYRDSKYADRGEEARNYLEIKKNTTRKTTLTTIFRFLENGSNLYIASDSYILGSLNVRALIIKILLFLFVLQVPAFFGNISATLYWLPILSFLGGILNLFTLLLYLLIILWFWGDVIRGTLLGYGFYYSLRHQFKGALVNASFDTDDCLMFLKSLLPLILDSLHEVLEENNMLDESVDSILRDLAENIKSQKTSTINISGGNIIGSAIGGLGNLVKGS